LISIDEAEGRQVVDQAGATGLAVADLSADTSQNTVL
jgi:hypothetical protein